MKPTAKSKTTTRAEAKARRQAARTPPPGWRDPLASQQPLVSGAWLLRALLITLGCATLLAYLSLCLLFYQGQWQVVFHPSRLVSATPASSGMKYDEVRFDSTGTGTPQLAGWWIPAEANPAHAETTVLFLHDGRGSLSDTLPQLKTLHSFGVNIFAFDYRGFGNSVNDHPSEARVYEDADAAWTYLTDTRHLSSKTVVLYGTGLGATIAAETAVRHRQAAGLILENPAPPALSLIEADSRTHLLPIHWLFRDRFEIEPKLRLLGAELEAPVWDLLKSGKPAPTPLIVRHQGSTPNNPRILILLGPDPSADPAHGATLNQFLAGH